MHINIHFHLGEKEQKAIHLAHLGETDPADDKLCREWIIGVIVKELDKAVREYDEYMEGL